MLSPTAIVRTSLAAGTVLFAGVGLLLRDDPRWFAASGLCGLLWGGWGLLTDHVLNPLGEWSSQFFLRVSGGDPGVRLRPTLEDTINTLEQRLEVGSSRESDIRTARVLEELYRTVRKDPANAARVRTLVRSRYPDTAERGPVTDA